MSFYIVYDYATSGYTDLWSIHALCVQYIYIYVQYTHIHVQYMYLFTMK